MNIELPKPYPAQEKLLSEVKRNNLLILSRRWGKTTLTSRLLKWSALTKEKFRAAFSAPTYKLTMETFEEYRNTLKPAISRVVRDDKRIELVNGSIIEFWSSDDISAGRGRRYNLWVSDESQRQKNLAAFIRGAVRPTLADFMGTVYVLGTANGEGSELHDFYLDCVNDPAWFIAHGKLEENPYMDAGEILQMRRDLGPELAAQELDSQWVRLNGISPLIRKIQWEQMYGEKQNVNIRKVLAVDASVSGDMTAIIAAWTDGEFYYVDHDDVEFFEPDPVTGEIDYLDLEGMLFSKWQTGKYSTFCYDPYQLVGMMQRLRAQGVRTVEFTQINMRLKSDSYLRQVLNENKLKHPDHYMLNEHVYGATLKYSGNAVRLVKSTKNAKIDLIVALSMAIWVLKENGTNGYTQYTTAAGNHSLYIPQQAPQFNPFTGLDKLSPYGKGKG